MPSIEFVEHQVTARVPELTTPTNIIEVPLTVRVDPLTGHTSRLITGTKLAPSKRPDLSRLTADPPFCPFCADKLEQATGVFAPDIVPEGKIRRGNAAVVPNVMAYSEFSSVGLYDVNSHFRDLDQLDATTVGDLVAAMADYTRAVQRLRPMWSSINANYLPPSGSSLAHPHAQSAHDDFGTTTQRNLVGRSDAWAGSAPYWQELVEAERDGDRWVAQVGQACVLTPWAPVGFHEVWAVVPGTSDIADLTEHDCADLGTIMSGVFAAYHSLHLTSFNWALYGGGPAPSGRYSLLLRIVSRSNAEPMYRSDVTFFERLHAEAMIDMTPEETASVMRQFIGTV